MNYQETLNYLYNSTPVFEHVGAVAYKEGLQNTLALDKHFNHPHTNFKTIHIAGTNGKGSCSINKSVSNFHYACPFRLSRKTRKTKKAGTN